MKASFLMDRDRGLEGKLKGGRIIIWGILKDTGRRICIMGLGNIFIRIKTCMKEAGQKAYSMASA